MISARAGTAYEATLEGADAGLVGTLALTVDDSDGDSVTARSTANIVELSDGTDPGRGVYVATRTAPTLAEDVTQAAFTLIWDEGDPEDEEHTYADTLLVWAAPALEGLPTPSEVAAILRARTKDANGNVLGEFTEDTTPTETQVARLIGTAAGEVAGRVGTDLPEAVQLFANSLIVVRAAMLVEMAYFPEQVDEGISPERELRFIYENSIGHLVSAVQIRSAFTETDPAAVP